MKELFIIRHGLAGKRLEAEDLDVSRPLTKKGKEKMKDVSKGLNALGVSFDRVLTSPLPRASETAEILVKCCVDPKNVEATDLLKPGAKYDDLVSYLNKLDGVNSVALIGHEPFLSEFGSYCLSKSKTSFINLKKGSVMLLEMDGPLKPGKCKLSWLLQPSQLIGLY